MLELIINNILQRIERTGGYSEKNSYEFNHVVVSEEEYEFILKNVDSPYDFYEELCDENNINHLSVEKNGTINFIHATSLKNLEKIKESGFKNDYESTFVGDIGKGLYVVENGDDEGLDNLNEYLEDCYTKDDSTIAYDTEVGFIIGVYSGPYYQCLYGEAHEGYILLKGDLEKNIKIESVEIEKISRWRTANFVVY